MLSSVQSGALTLLHTACGAGILAIPYAFEGFGVFMGCLMLIFCGCCSMTGLLIQSYVSEYIPSRKASFFFLSQISYPGLSVLFDCAITIKCFGVGISYLVIMGDLLPQILSKFTSNEWFLDRNVLISCCMLVVSPLCFMKTLESLKYASMVAISSVAYLCFLVLYHFLFPTKDITFLKGIISLGIPPNATIRTMLSSFPIFVFAYTCQHNMFSIINELPDSSIKTSRRVAYTAIVLAILLYMTIGNSGYLTFGDRVTDNIIALYPLSLSTTIGRIAILLLVMLAFPLQCHPARDSINNMWHHFTKNGYIIPEESSGLIKNTYRTNVSDSSANDIPTEQFEENDFNTTNSTPLEGLRFIVITSTILVFSYLVSVSVTSLAKVLAIVGATGSTSISFILPGIFGYQIIGSEYENKNIPTLKRLLRYTSLALTIWGFFVMIICLVAALFNGKH